MILALGTRVEVDVANGDECPVVNFDIPALDARTHVCIWHWRGV